MLRRGGAQKRPADRLFVLITIFFLETESFGIFGFSYGFGAVKKGDSTWVTKAIFFFLRLSPIEKILSNFLHLYADLKRLQLIGF